jgi:hypothetical protein
MVFGERSKDGGRCERNKWQMELLIFIYGAVSILFLILHGIARIDYAAVSLVPVVVVRFAFDVDLFALLFGFDIHIILQILLSFAMLIIPVVVWHKLVSVVHIKNFYILKWFGIVLSGAIVIYWLIDSGIIPELSVTIGVIATVIIAVLRHIDFLKLSAKLIGEYNEYDDYDDT